MSTRGGTGTAVYRKDSMKKNGMPNSMTKDGMAKDKMTK